MAEKYRKFDASDYIRNRRGCARASQRSDGRGRWGRRRDSRGPEAYRSNSKHERARSRHRAKPGQSLRGALQRRQPHPGNAPQNHPRPGPKATPRTRRNSPQVPGIAQASGSPGRVHLHLAALTKPQSVHTPADLNRRPAPPPAPPGKAQWPPGSAPEPPPSSPQPPRTPASPAHAPQSSSVPAQ